jgi:hypothetical protein
MRRWQVTLDSKSDETTARKGKWTTDEDSTLKDAVEKHSSGKNWVAISALVPGRANDRVGIDGSMSWTPRATRRRHAGVTGQKMKTVR